MKIQKNWTGEPTLTEITDTARWGLRQLPSQSAVLTSALLPVPPPLVLSDQPSFPLSSFPTSTLFSSRPFWPADNLFSSPHFNLSRKAHYPPGPPTVLTAKQTPSVLSFGVSTALLLPQTLSRSSRSGSQMTALLHSRESDCLRCRSTLHRCPSKLQGTSFCLFYLSTSFNFSLARSCFLAFLPYLASRLATWSTQATELEPAPGLCTCVSFTSNVSSPSNPPFPLPGCPLSSLGVRLEVGSDLPWNSMPAQLSYSTTLLSLISSEPPSLLEMI